MATPTVWEFSANSRAAKQMQRLTRKHSLQFIQQKNKFISLWSQCNRTFHWLIRCHIQLFNRKAAAKKSSRQLYVSCFESRSPPLSTECSFANNHTTFANNPKQFFGVFFSAFSFLLPPTRLPLAVCFWRFYLAENNSIITSSTFLVLVVGLCCYFPSFSHFTSNGKVLANIELE